MKLTTQRDVARHIIRSRRINTRQRHIFIRYYAAAEIHGEVTRVSNVNEIDAHTYAAAIWADGHAARDPWMLKLLRSPQ